MTKADLELPVREAPFGKAAIRRSGSDVTFVTYGPSVPTALKAATAAAEDGVDVEVVDLRTIVPLDDETVMESVSKTGRCIVIAESQGFAGVSGEPRRAHHRAVLPLSRGSRASGQRSAPPYPAPKLEHTYLPGVDRILDAVDRLQWDDQPDLTWDRPADASGVPHEGAGFHPPDLGEGLTEAEIVEWLVGDGDQVQVDQPVVVVETAKASVEVPCPYAGRVATRHGGTGDTLQVGEPLLTVGGDAEGLGDERPDSSRSDSEASGAVLIGYGTSTAPTRRTRRAQRVDPPVIDLSRDPDSMHPPVITACASAIALRESSRRSSAP